MQIRYHPYEIHRDKELQMMSKEEDIPLWISLFEKRRQATNTNLHYPWFQSLPVPSREIMLDIYFKVKAPKRLKLEPCLSFI